MFRKKSTQVKCQAGTKKCGGICIKNSYVCRLDEHKIIKQKIATKLEKPIEVSAEKPAEKPAEKTKPKFNNVTALIVGASVVTIGGGLTYFALSNEKRIIPESVSQKEINNAPIGNAPKNKDILPEPYNPLLLENKIKGVAYEVDKHGQPLDREQFKLRQRAHAQSWAREVLTDLDTVILDTETTSLMQGIDPYDPDAQIKYRADLPGIFQIALCDVRNRWEADILLNPEKKLSIEAAAVVGQSPEDWKDSPTFREVYPQLKSALDGKRVLAFNARFDLQLIDALCIKHGLDLIEYKNRPAPGMPMDNDADVMHYAALYLGKNARPSRGSLRQDTTSKFDNKKIEPNPNQAAGTVTARDQFTRTPRDQMKTVDFENGLAFTYLPTMPGAEAHNALSDVYSTMDLLRHMALGKELPK